jgi:uncharacterized protein (DUF2336 family)
MVNQLLRLHWQPAAVNHLLQEQVAVSGEVVPGLDVSIFDGVIEKGGNDARRQLAHQLGMLLANPETPRSERAIVVPSVLKLAVDPVAEVRRALAEGLMRAPNLHPDIFFSVVADQDDIALPFLAATPSLDPWKMITILKVGDVARQVQVALRNDLTVQAIDTICERCDVTACLALFQNANLSLSDRNCHALYKRFGQVPEIVEFLLARPDLPLDIRITQTKRASNRIHQLMAERGWVAANDAAELVVDAEETAVLKVLVNASVSELKRVIGFLTQKNMLVPSLIVRAACLGEMLIVENAIAHLAGMSEPRTQLLMYRNGFKSLFTKSGLPETCYWILKAAADVEREVREESIQIGRETFGRRLIEVLMTRYENLGPSECAKNLEFIGRYSEERVRVIARRLKLDMLRAA